MAWKLQFNQLKTHDGWLVTDVMSGMGVGSGSEHASAILEWPSKWTRHRQGQALTLIVHHCQKTSVEKIANFLAPMVCLRAVLGFLWSALSGKRISLTKLRFLSARTVY